MLRKLRWALARRIAPEPIMAIRPSGYFIPPAWMFEAADLKEGACPTS